MRINNKKDLPKWFSLNKYKAFSSMNDNDLLFQLMSRVFATSVGNDYRDGYFESVIKDTSVLEVEHLGIDANELDKDLNFLSSGPCQRIAEDLVVKPLTISNVFDMNRFLDWNGFYLNSDEFDSHDEKLQHFDIFYLDDSLVHCSIAISSSDEFILASMKRLLPIWRQQLSAVGAKGEEVKTSWEVNRQKLIAYQAFAFYDLLQWERVTGNKITKSVLAAALYPDGEYGEIAIAQTIKGFVEKIFSEKSLEKIATEFHVKEGLG
ncbi:DUF6387 family protein [Citrobacter freundii]|uniref:DUF6387 family protein n=1 Tax=Citrobacter freundii TaxID=546 RepID=UPI0016492941|nr:DUF6387 family protein [Citrobacter freundii]